MEEMRKEFSHISKNKDTNNGTSRNFTLIPQLSRLQSVNRIVGVDKYLHEWFLIKLVHLTKPLAYQTEEFLVSPEINFYFRRATHTFKLIEFTFAEHNSR